MMLAPRHAFAQAPPISRAGWTVQFVDSQDTPNGNVATNVFDGFTSTFWHTQWVNASPPPPHEIQINLGGVYAVSGFRYLARQDAPYGRIAQYEFYVSANGTTWGTPVATGTFANSTTEQQVLFTAKTGQFVRLRELSEVAGRPYGAVAELNVLGTASGNQPPNGVITSPAGDVTIAPGQSVTFAGTGSDPDNNLPLTYQWNFGAGGPPPSTSQNPGAVVFPAAGVYTVTFTVTDALGAPDPTPATRTVTVQTTTSVTVIPQTNWTLRFVDSQETQGENGAAINAFDGNPNTVWVTKWFNGGPAPPHEIQINLGAVYGVTGFRYLPRQDTQAWRVGDYEFYVSADGSNWGSPVAVGSFPDTNSSASREVLFVPKTGQYIRFRALSEVNGGGLTATAIAELNVLRAGTGANQAPVASMSSPASDITVVAGSALSLSGSATDPDANLPLTYTWGVGPGSGIADQTTASPGIVQFDRAGTFSVTFTVADALGKTASITRNVTVVAGSAIASTGWALLFVDSQDTANGNVAINAFDGNPSTFWHTQWITLQPPPPHEIQINLGATREVRGFRYLPRQDGVSSGNIGQYQFYVSADGVNWGVPVASGTFENSASAKDVATAGKSGRYVRLQALTEVNGRPYTAVAELQIMVPVCLGPSSVRLIDPVSRYLQTSTSLLLRADACVSSGQGVRFVIDGGARADYYTAPYSATVTGLARSEHVVEAFLIDGGGVPVSGVATYDQATPVGIGDYYVATGDGITVGFGDNAPGDDNSADGRNMQGGFTPILANGLTSAKGRPVTVVNEGISGAASSTGVATIQTLLQKHPNAQYVLIMYGHNDYRDGVPSGRGLGPPDPGYAGSFKHNIQRIIDAIKAAGKTALLAKAPAILPLSGPANAAVQQYNFVMDELAADINNGIPVAPPDFYSYFAAHTTTEYNGDITPNGVGYQSMANIWLQALRPLP